MKRRTAKWVIVACGALLLAGCEETSTKVQVRPPAAVPDPAPPTYAQERLPIPDRPLSAVSLRLDPRPAIDILVERVQASLSTGQQDFQSGNPDKGRADLDDAINLILLSGFQAESDPRLSKLFDQIGEAMHALLPAAGQGIEEDAEDAEAAPPAQPAPIDELADLTPPPGDPCRDTIAHKPMMRLVSQCRHQRNVLTTLCGGLQPAGRALSG